MINDSSKIERNQFIQHLIDKYQLSLETPNELLKEFVLEFNSVLKQNSIKPLDRDKLDVFKCCYNHMGHRGRCIGDADYVTILIFTGFFAKWLHKSPEKEKEIVYDYAETLAHELAHYLADTDETEYSEEEKTINGYTNGHGKAWRKYASILGVNKELISAMDYQEKEKIIMEKKDVVYSYEEICGQFKLSMLEISKNIINTLSGYIRWVYSINNEVCWDSDKTEEIGGCIKKTIEFTYTVLVSDISILEKIKNIVSKRPKILKLQGTIKIRIQPDEVGIILSVSMYGETQIREELLYRNLYNLKEFTTRMENIKYQLNDAMGEYLEILKGE